MAPPNGNSRNGTNHRHASNGNGRSSGGGKSTYDRNVPPSLAQPVHICAQPNEFPKYYSSGPELGLGAFAQVFLGTHKKSGQQYAIKKIDRAKMVWGDRDALADEINSLIHSRQGPNIVQLYEVYEEAHDCYLVMELMHGGELFDRILDQKVFTEWQARATVAGMLRALEHMHSKRVAHRDLKPENLLLINPDTWEVKLADYGFAKKVPQANGLRTLCGTPGYLAPEILERFPAYDTPCDLWSVGVILFLLLGGYLPFEDEDEDVVFDRTRNGEYHFHHEYWKTISTDAKKMVARLLTVNPQKRYTATQALQDKWMTIQDDEEQSAADAGASSAPQTASASEHDSPDALDKIKNKQLKPADKTKPTNDRIKDLTNQVAEYQEHEREKKAKKEKRFFEEDSKNGGKFSDYWELGDMLGEGGYACVFRAKHKRTGDICAVKDIDTSVLEKNSKNALSDEIKAMKMLRGGPHIIRLLDVFEEPQHTFMVMEECRGGDLLTRITEKEVYTERECRKTCKILFQAMNYIHTMKVAHRDIKPENVLMVSPDDDHAIKICDFGFAKKVTKPLSLRTLCGTAQYVAPEVLDLQSAGYDYRADMWSVGVVVYILLGGYAPFEGPVQELARAICKGEYYFHDKYWSEISDDAKDMISSLLQTDCTKRLSAEEALQCPWMTVEEELLGVTDLSTAQAEIKSRKEGASAPEPSPTNKFDSLPEDFAAALGTEEEVEGRKAARTDEPVDLEPIDEDGEYEDSWSGKPFEMLYKEGTITAETELAEVLDARHRQSREIFSVKRVERYLLDTEDAVALQDEIGALKAAAGSPFVIQLHDIFDEPEFTYIVMEKLRGGTLLDQIGEKRCFSENEARSVARRVLHGLEHMHNRRIAHRNIQCETLILHQEGDVTEVKITDFSMSKRALYPNSLETLCGTEGYIAPEVMDYRPQYDVPVDMWSFGVVLYMMLGGYRPFRGEESDIIRQTKYGNYKFHKRFWKTVSEEAKIFITRNLTVNPLGRITATAALQSEWMTMNTEQNRRAIAHDAKVKFRAAVHSIIAIQKMEAMSVR